MYDYGNARIAARRARLLDAAALRRLSEASSPATLLVLLGAHDDWRAVLAEVEALSTDAASAVDAAVERHRSRRLAALPRWYAGRPRRLVEALVVPLDVERLLAVLRRRRAGDSPEAVGAAVAPGALLGAGGVGQLARAATVEAMLHLASAFGLLDPLDAAAVGRLAAAGVSPPRIEAALVDAADAARLRRAHGATADARRAREVIEREIATRANAAEVLRESGAGAATFVERSESLARLVALASVGRRDPLGIGAVAGYVAAIELQAIRLRAILAATATGWPPALVGEFLDAPRATVRTVG